MLSRLYVENLALIDKVDVEFSKGLNILTGETGAGKSILLGAMHLLLGGKATKGLIRNGREYAYVEATFIVNNEDILNKLKELEVYPEDGLLICSRKLNDQGKTLNKINCHSVTLNQLKSVTSLLIDIHGQNEHQSLLNNKIQLEIIDTFGNKAIVKKKETVKDLYLKYIDIKNKLEDLKIDDEKQKREISFCEFEINEIRSFNLLPNEDKILEEKYRLLCNGQKIIDSLSMAINLIEEQGSAQNISKATGEISHIIDFDKGIEEIYNNIITAEDLLSNSIRALKYYIEDFDYDEKELKDVEERLDGINTLKRKYGDSYENIMNYLSEKEKELEVLNNIEEIRNSLNIELSKITKRLLEACKELSIERTKYAKELENSFIGALMELNFNQVKFEIKIEDVERPTENGKDKVEFNISTNPGEPLKPLNEVVSGGELSRIMLALKSILANNDNIETLIFDEIDTGISGKTAYKVAEKMGEIALSHQVLAITHLPQISSMADCHFEIKKVVNNNYTETIVEKLDQEGSINEIARLIGGDEITENAKNSAIELIKKSQNYKKNIN